MTANYKTATIFGGTGFVGKQIVRELAAKGFRVKVATRVPERAYFLKPYGNVGQVVPFQCDYSDPKSITQAIEGSEIVVNCIGILFENARQKFQGVHVDLPVRIAKAASKAGVSSFVHISALGCDTGTSKYAQSKLEGEQGVFSNFKNAVILRPSIIFGEDDNFFNMFAGMSTVLPILPLIGGGTTKFQPVYVGDVADAVIAATNDANTHGKIYALGGPEVMSFKALFEKMFEYTQNPVPLVPVPFGLAKLQAFFLSLLPTPLLTRDQVESLKTDNIVAGDALTLIDLGVNATALDMILPNYLTRYRKGGRFADTSLNEAA
ncbi:MAG: complex I NDUFA9 subunit family protein [Alphaproteobacteria bacterium]